MTFSVFSHLMVAPARGSPAAVQTAYPETPRRLAIRPGIVYGDGLELGNPPAITPIGVTCRLCERPNGPSPLVTWSLRIDANRLEAWRIGWDSNPR